MDIIGENEVTKPIRIYCLKMTLLTVRNPGKNPFRQKACNHRRTRRFGIPHAPCPMEYEFIKTPLEHCFVYPHQRGHITHSLSSKWTAVLQCLMNTCIFCFIPLLTPLKHTRNTADRLLLADWQPHLSELILSRNLKRKPLVLSYLHQMNYQLTKNSTHQSEF